MTAAAPTAPPPPRGSLRSLAGLARERARRRLLLRPGRVVGPAFRPRRPGDHRFAAFGAGSAFAPPVHLTGTERMHVGARVVVLECSQLAVGPTGSLVLADDVALLRFTSILCNLRVEIGAGVLTSDYATVTDSWGPLGPAGRGAPPPAPVVVEAGAYLGAHSVIGPGVRVGPGAFVGEGAVVLEDVPAHSAVYGNPAAITCRYDAEAGGWRGAHLP